MIPLAKSTAPNALNHWGFFFFVQGAMPLNYGLGPVVAMQCKACPRFPAGVRNVLPQYFGVTLNTGLDPFLQFSVI